MHMSRITLALFALLFWGSLASAQVCTFTNTGVDFGNVNLTTGAINTATGTLSASCTGTPRTFVDVCANFNAGSGGAAASGDPRYMVQGATRLNYNLARNAGGMQIWGSYLWGASSRPPSIRIRLNNSGTGTSSDTIYGRIYGAQTTAPTGTFISTFTGGGAQIDYGYSGSFSCGTTLSPRVQAVPFVVRATNNSNCLVSATDLDFGVQTDLSSATLSTNAIYITCTAGTAYTVGLSNGTSGATSPALRKMTNTTTTDTVGYSIYLDAARSQVWGSGTSGGMAAAVGTGLAQGYVGYGKIPAQATPAPLSYADTVVVSITY
jgi:spore coat protein U-like protein